MSECSCTPVPGCNSNLRLDRRSPLHCDLRLSGNHSGCAPMLHYEALPALPCWNAASGDAAYRAKGIGNFACFIEPLPALTSNTCASPDFEQSPIEEFGIERR